MEKLRIIAIATVSMSTDEATRLCAACSARCNTIAGVRAHRWEVNPATGVLTGVVKWSDAEAIAMGTEALRLEVARLHEPENLLVCRDMACPIGERATRYERDTSRNTGFVQHPPDYDPRG